MDTSSSAWPDAPFWSELVFPARNANEAQLFLQCQGGEQIESRAVATEYHVLARHPEGPRVHRFTLARSAPWDPTDFGEGQSGILDPAELLFFADRVVRELPSPGDPVHPRAVIRRLRLGAAALREAVRLLPPGGLGEARFFTDAARSYAQAHPERFTAEALEGFAAAMDHDAEEWQRLSMTIIETLTAFRENAVSQDFFLRSVLRHPSWHVPADEADHPALWTLGGRGFVAAQSTPTSPDGSRTCWMTMDGRHLVRNLPSDCAGVVFELGTPADCVIELDGSADTLAYWVSALDVEDALLNPAPGQQSSLLSHEWFLLCTSDGDPLVESAEPFRVVHAFTAPDRLREFMGSRPVYRQSVIVRLIGRELFSALSTRSDYDAILLHHGSQATAEVGPQGAALFVDGVDGRSSARVLPARTTAEIHQFLDLEGASRHDRTHQLEYLGGELVARYAATVAGSQRTWWFQPVTASEDPSDLGAGPSAILCAGQLADLVRRRLRALPENPVRLDPDDRLTAAGAARWAREIEKMLVGESIPRSAIRTPDGSRFVREFPEMTTAEWIRDARRRAEVLAGA